MERRPAVSHGMYVARHKDLDERTRRSRLTKTVRATKGNGNRQGLKVGPNNESLAGAFQTCLKVEVPSVHSYMESRMSARVRTLNLAKRTPKFGEKKEEDPGLRQRINVLATLAIGLLKEVEDMGSAVTKVTTRRSRPIQSLDACASVLCGQPIDFYKEVERYEIDLIKRALRHTGGSQRRAAQLLNLRASTLNAKLKNYGIDIVGPAMQRPATPLDDEPRAPETTQTIEQPGAPSLPEGDSKKA